MFRKLISHLPYSPALITDIGFYAKRLRQEDATRRTTLLFVVLTISLQSLAVFTPPEPVNASSQQDIIRGGVSSLDDFLHRYDRNEDDVKDIYSTIGVTRSEIANAKPGIVTTDNDTYILTRYGKLGTSKNEAQLPYLKSSGGKGERYFVRLSSITDKSIRLGGWVGNSTSLGWFAIVRSSASPAIHGLSPSLNLTGSEKQTVLKELSSRNLSPSSPSANQEVKPNNKISYTLKDTNTGSYTASSYFNISLSDILEYATLLDTGGGTFNDKTKSIAWPQVELSSGESQTRTFTVQIVSNIPAIGVGKSNPASFDCKIVTQYGNTIQYPVDCPPAKNIENIFSMLPTIGSGPNIVFALLLLTVSVFFYVRTRQLKKEIRIIRHNFNSGII